VRRLSKLINLDVLTDRYKGDDFKDKEVARFETKFPGARIVQDHYDNERDLEEDWQGYCLLPYHLKVLCNERCLRLYGKKNEEQYLTLKKEFMRRDIPNPNLFKAAYRPMGFREGEEVDQAFLNKQAQEYMDHGGHSILRTDYDSLQDLNSAYYDFNNQCHDHMRIANDKSRELFGCSVPEVYRKEVKRFLMADIKGTDYDSPIRPVVVDSLSATEAVLDYVRSKDAQDLIESILFTESARIEASTPVERTLVSLMEEECNTKGSFPRPLGYSPQFLLPWETMGLVENVDALMVDPLFVNHYARNLGIKPPMVGYHEAVRQLLETETNPNQLLRVGWLPVLRFNESNLAKANDRANRAILEHMHYKVVNLSHTPAMLTESDREVLKPKGISVLIIKELDKDHLEAVQDVPKVLVTLDQDDPSWWTVLYGQLSYKQGIDSVLKQYSVPSASCYFLQTSDTLYDALQGNVERFNQGNEIQKVTMALQTASPEIADKGLFIMNLFNSLIYPEYGDQPFPLRLNDRHDGKADAIHLLYSGINPSWKAIHDSYSKLSIYTEYVELETSFFLKGANMVATLNESIDDYSHLTIGASTIGDKWKRFRTALQMPLQSPT